MPASTIDALFRSLSRGQFAPAYYLHGPEDLLKDEVIQAVVGKALDPGLRDFNLDQHSAAQLDEETVLSLCRTPPMMADRRVIVVRDVEAWKRKPRTRAAALGYLARPATDVVLLLVQGAADDKEDRDIARVATTVVCHPFSADRAARWVRDRAQRLDVQLEGDAAEHLVGAVGTDLGALASELEKLAAASDGAPFTAESVAAMVGVRHGETILDWRDAIFDDEPGRAALLLGPVLGQAGATGVKLVTAVGTTVLGLAATRAAYDRNVRGSRLEQTAFALLRGSRPYWLLGWGEESRRWARWAPRWAPSRIRTALRAALEADTALKTTSVSDERGVLLDLVLRLGVAPGVAA